MLTYIGLFFRNNISKKKHLHMMLKVLSTSFPANVAFNLFIVNAAHTLIFCCTQPSERRKYKPGFGREKHCHLCSVISIMITEPYVKSLPA